MGSRSGGRSGARGSGTGGSSAGAGQATGASPPPLRGRAREGGDAFTSGGQKPFGRDAARRRGPLTIEGELVAKSTGTVSAFTIGDRVFHQKFGNGNVVNIDGNKLTIQFDKAGEKRVVDSFVERL
jgi:DNA helicase II / ATP-dependent DNA helicase PcrA